MLIPTNALNNIRGDPYYVGLNGIDIFDDNGDVMTIGHGISSITAVPGDINDLPEYDHDPRKASNLLGIYYTFIIIIVSALHVCVICDAFLICLCLFICCTLL